MDRDTEGILKYLFEAGMLKRTSRSGWWAVRINDPESVSDHSHRTAIIAYLLAMMEGENPEKICCAAVFHDLHETRLGDLNKITARYLDVGEETVRKITEEQNSNLPEPLRKEIPVENKLSERELEILKDADYLECAIQAKEYLDSGWKGVERWIENIGKKLRTGSAKRIHEKIADADSNSWWKGLKRI